MPSYPRGDETRRFILHTALKLFSKNGYDATSVADICRGASVSKGAFYYHFPSKQDLFLALMASWLDALAASYQETMGLTEDIPQALVTMAEQTTGLFGALEGGFPILLEFWTQASRQPELWEKVVEPYRQYLAFFVELIQQGQADGAFTDALVPERSARLLMAVAMGLLLQATFDPQGADWQDVSRSGIRMIIEGMRRKA